MTAPNLDEPLAVSPAKAAELLGLSKPSVYVLLNSDRLPSVKVGARRLISVEALHDFLGDTK